MTFFWPLDFYPRPPRGGRLQQARKRREAEEFLSTPSARRATSTLANIYSTIKDFYPRPPRGGRLANPDRGASTTLFLSTPSARRATGLVGRLDDVHAISIHALREEGDLANIGEQAILNKISIHALREEGDLQDILLGGRRRGFLSTPSARRATWVRRRPGEKVQNFYPRPPRGGRPAAAVNTCTIRIFLSTPSARRATAGANEQHSISKFLSTPSARRATFKDFYNDTYTVISIHALREEGDGERHWAVGTDSDFYPRPLRGGRRCRLSARWCRLHYFYPRPPRGGRRESKPKKLKQAKISIHALREEGDMLGPAPAPLANLFLSTPSARRATGSAVQYFILNHISIHALREEGDLWRAAEHSGT